MRIIRQTRVVDRIQVSHRLNPWEPVEDGYNNRRMVSGYEYGMFVPSKVLRLLLVRVTVTVVVVADPWLFF